MYFPSGDHVGPESAKLSFVMFVICFVSRSRMKMSPTAPWSPAKTTFLPSGEKSGDSGSSTVLISILSSTFLVSTFWMTSVRVFSLLTKNARRSPLGDHDSQGTVLKRPPGDVMYSHPLSWSKPFVRFRMTEPSFEETSTMSSSPSFRLPVATAMRSPDGDGSAEMAWLNELFSGLGARFRP